MQKGDLAFLPSEVILKQFDKDTTAVSKYCKTQKPCHVVVVQEFDKCYSVLFEGETWTVPEKCLYPILEKENGNSQTYGNL